MMQFLRELKVDMKYILSSINNKMDSMSSSINTLRQEHSELKAEIKSLWTGVQSVKQKLDKNEGHSRRNNLSFMV